MDHHGYRLSNILKLQMPLLKKQFQQGAPGGAPTHNHHPHPSTPLRVTPYFLPLFRSTSVRNFFRRRILSGVTSTSSSSPTYSSACSNVIGFTGVSEIASSFPDARMLLNFFPFVTFTTRS